MLFFQIADSPTTWVYEHSTFLACDTFSCALEASLHSRPFWTAFSARSDVPELVQHLILGDARSRLRENIAEIISDFCKSPARYVWSTLTLMIRYTHVNDRPSQVAAPDLTRFLWRLLSSILPTITERSKQVRSAPLFDASLAVLRAIGDLRRDVLDLDTYVSEWGNLLIGHVHEEVCSCPRSYQQRR